MNIVVRDASIKDVDSITYISTYSWISTYEKIVSKDEINHRIETMEKRKNHTKDIIENNNRFLVAEMNGNVVGFLSYSKSRNDIYNNYGEIIAIYILKEYQGQGIGKQLFIQGIKKLVELGYNKMILNVLNSNENAIRFYKKFGGVKIESKEETFGGKKVIEDIMCFDNLKDITSYNK